MNYENTYTWTPSEHEWRTHIDNGYGGVAFEEESDMYSDLYFPDRAMEIAHANQRLLRAQEYADHVKKASVYRELGPSDINESVLEDARYAQVEFQRRLDEMSAQDTLFSHAIQDWTVEELRARESARGYMYEQGSVDSHLETIAVLDQLLLEVRDDQTSGEVDDVEVVMENEKLIEMIQMWRQETLAELTQVELRRLYELAA